SSRAAMIGFAVVFGLGLGGEYLIIPLMAAELVGVRLLGRVMGIILTADGIADAVSPTLIGSLPDRTRTDHLGFYVRMAIALLAAGAIGLMARESKESASLSPAGAGRAQA